MTKVCQRCGNTFTKPYCESRKDWETRHRYCSAECRYPPRVHKTCAHCGKPFSVKAYRGDTARFCSHKCSEQFRDEGKKTAAQKIRNSAAYNAWRLAVFERDEYACVECGDHNYKGRGTTVVLHADHIKPFALYPELRFDTSNGRTLCVSCHRASGTYGRGAVYRVAVA